jgi:hypothetical protein
MITFSKILVNTLIRVIDLPLYQEADWFPKMTNLIHLFVIFTFIKMIFSDYLSSEKLSKFSSRVIHRRFSPTQMLLTSNDDICKIPSSDFSSSKWRMADTHSFGFIQRIRRFNRQKPRSKCIDKTCCLSQLQHPTL